MGTLGLRGHSQAVFAPVGGRESVTGGSERGGSHSSNIGCIEPGKGEAKRSLQVECTGQAAAGRGRRLEASMDPEVRSAVAGKRIVLFEKMLEASEFPDKGVSQELRFGANLVGEVPTTGVLPGKFVPATMTQDALEVQARLLKERGGFVIDSSGDKTTDEQVWLQTMEEVSHGWLQGPMEFEQVPLEAPITRRFGLSQKDKLRLIDDFSESNINSAVSVFESPVLHTVDTAAAMICSWMTAAAVSNTDSSLVARTFDLKSAYQQIALCESGKKFAHIAVYCPHLQRAQFFKSLVLPFGAVRSVHSFLRVARAIWWIGTKLFKLMWTSFYDDYILLSPPSLSRSAEASAQALLRLLGWVFAEDGRKAAPFDTNCKALGVCFVFDDSGAGRCEIKNTPERIQELCKDLMLLVERGKVSGHEDFMAEWFLQTLKSLAVRERGVCEFCLAAPRGFRQCSPVTTSCF